MPSDTVKGAPLYRFSDGELHTHETPLSISEHRGCVRSEFVIAPADPTSPGLLEAAEAIVPAMQRLISDCEIERPSESHRRLDNLAAALSSEEKQEDGRAKALQESEVVGSGDVARVAVTEVVAQVVDFLALNQGSTFPRAWDKREPRRIDDPRINHEKVMEGWHKACHYRTNLIETIVESIAATRDTASKDSDHDAGEPETATDKPDLIEPGGHHPDCTCGLEGCPVIPTPETQDGWQPIATIPPFGLKQPEVVKPGEVHIGFCDCGAIRVVSAGPSSPEDWNEHVSHAQAWGRYELGEWALLASQEEA